MFKKIAVGMDGSERAEHALITAEQVARESGASLVITHVDEQTVGKGGGHLRADEHEIVVALEKKAQNLRDAGVDASVEVAAMMTGSVGNRLAEMAAAAGADLIVVGTRGHSGVAGTLLGSASHKLLAHAHVPVLVVPDAEQAAARGALEAKAGTAS